MSDCIWFSYQATDKHGGVVPTEFQRCFMMNVFVVNKFVTRRDSPPMAVRVCGVKIFKYYCFCLDISFMKVNEF